MRKNQKNKSPLLQKFWKTLAVWVLVAFMLQGTVITAWASTTPTGVSLESIESTVDKFMEAKIGVATPGASVVIVKDGEIVLCKGYGLSDIEANKSVSGPDTPFEIGSVTKLFTWTAIMQLAEEGKLDLQADIRDYIGQDRLVLNFDKPITVLDLLNHTAGFEENIGEMMTFTKENIIPLEEWVSKAHQPQQIYEPGSTIAYSNFSTDIAGYIVQLVSGQRYEDYINDHILKPLEMNNSTAYADYYHLPHIVDAKSKGYSLAENGFQLTPENFINEAPAGSITATAEDMGHFMIAHLNREGTAKYSLFNSPDTLKEMQSPSHDMPNGMPANAHGFWGRTENGVRLLEHGGNTTNFSALVSLVPDENFGICVLTNVEGESGGTRTELVSELSAKFHHEATVNPSIERSTDLSGAYASARTVKSGFVSLVYLLPEGIAVKDLKNGEIELTFMDSKEPPARYAEIEPLVFERTESIPTGLDKVGGSMTHLKFILDDAGKVKTVSTGNIVDYVSLPLYRNATLNRSLFIGCVAIFILGFIYMVISKIIARKKGNVAIGKAGIILPLLGILSVANAVISIMRIMADLSTPLSNQRIHLYINIAFAIGMLVSSFFVAKGLQNKELSKKDKVISIILIIAAVLYIVWEVNYRLFAFWAI